MIVVDQVPWVVLLMIGGMLMLGTWPAVWNKVELSGRLPAHTFLDYTVAYLVVAVVTSLTFGQLGPSYHDLPNFLEQLQQPNGPVVAFAIAGGICLSLGDIAMQYAVAFLGLSIGPPILNALTIIIGIILSYFLDGGINQAHLVFTGMACAAIAIALGTAAHLTHPATKQQLATAAAKRRQKKAAAAAAAGGCEPDQEDPSTTSAASADCTAVLPPPSADQDTVSSRDCTVTIPPAAVQQQPGAPVSSSSSMSGAGAAAAAPVAAAAAPAVAVLVPSHPAGAAAVLVGVGGCEGPSELQEELIKEPAPERSVDTSNMSVYLGLAIAIVGGAVYSLFLPGFQIAANDVFGLLPPGVPPLSIYAANFYFALGFAVVSGIMNIWFLYHPPLGTARSSLTAYLKDNKARAWSLLSGVLASCGDLTQFAGGQAVGYAAAMLVMAYPLVGVLWGMVHFKEGKQSSRLSKALLGGQVLAYAASVGLLAGSAQLRSHHAAE